MVSKKTIIRNKTGIHLRPANLLSNVASSFESRISLKKGSVTVNAKSVLGLLSVGVGRNDEVEIICEGKDENEALERICRLIEDGLGDSIEE